MERDDPTLFLTSLSRTALAATSLSWYLGKKDERRRSDESRSLATQVPGQEPDMSTQPTIATALAAR
jgi:hypothetical protein